MAIFFKTDKKPIYTQNRKNPGQERSLFIGLNLGRWMSGPEWAAMISSAFRQSAGTRVYTYLRSPKWAIAETIWTIDPGGMIDDHGCIGV